MRTYHGGQQNISMLAITFLCSIAIPTPIKGASRLLREARMHDATIAMLCSTLPLLPHPLFSLSSAPSLLSSPTLLPCPLCSSSVDVGCSAVSAPCLALPMHFPSPPMLLSHSLPSTTPLPCYHSCFVPSALSLLASPYATPHYALLFPHPLLAPKPLLPGG